MRRRRHLLVVTCACLLGAAAGAAPVLGIIPVPIMDPGTNYEASIELAQARVSEQLNRQVRQLSADAEQSLNSGNCQPTVETLPGFNLAEIGLATPDPSDGLGRAALEAALYSQAEPQNAETSAFRNARVRLTTMSATEALATSIYIFQRLPELDAQLGQLSTKLREAQSACAHRALAIEADALSTEMRALLAFTRSMRDAIRAHSSIEHDPNIRAPRPQ